MLNESGFLEDMMKLIDGCVIYIFYIEGVGGGYAFDIIKVVMYLNVLLVLINLICLFMKNIIDEYLDMLMVCYYLDKCVLEDVVFVDSCICFEIIVVEDILYDMGVFLIMSLDF